ncbi:GNAT family N-acetyltransferase [Streptomyces sp. NBC_01716]|uniref:GNAT family N-acetyltransferase n=1 Tax=Streptomyces sp. NBC_01716 TaxID=2975917 RepID=UPI002E3361B4|nr:GNAT family N-acetyltransferase [Streptomyces sp. NBC_01716]
MTPAEVLTYDLYEGKEAAAALDTFLPTYEEVYAEPPYSEAPSDVAEFIEHYQIHVQRDRMRLIIARDGDEIVGFTYGYLLPAYTSWWTNIQEELPEDFTREDGKRTWVIIELAVRRPWRRRGVAATLHAALLDGLHVERVTLTVRPEPEAAPAQSAYKSWGYRTVGVSHPWEDAPFYTAMVLELDGEPAQS